MKPAPGLLALALLATLATQVAANPHETETPREGDAAEYRLVRGTETFRAIFEWRVDPVFLPDGRVVPLPTLRASLVANAAPLDPGAASSPPRASFLNPHADDGLPPPAADSVAVHWSSYPSNAVAWSISWLDTTDGDRRVATRTTLGRCADAAWLLRWADPSCANGSRATPSESPGLPARVDGDGWSLEQVAIRRGAEPLRPVHLGPVATARVPLVEWGARGPADGDLAGNPFAAAHDALVAQDPDAAAYLASRPGARLLQARHAFATALVFSEEPWKDRLKGVPCVSPGAARTPGGEWSAGWIDHDGSLFGIVQRIGSPIALDRAIHADLDTYGLRHLGAAPAARAPAPQALADLLALVPPERGEVATIDYDFLPQGALASVSRGTCAKDPVTGRASYTGASITFVDGEARGTLTLAAERDRPPLPAGLSPAAAAPASAGGARIGGAPPSAPPAAALAAGAAGALLGGALLYHRIRPTDALANAKRARVYRFVCEAPGQTIQDIARGLGLPRNTVEHHVRTLEKNGFLRVHDGPRGKAVLPATSRVYEPVLDREHVRDLLRILKESPGISQHELAARLGMRKGHLSTLVRDLEACGFLARRRDGRSVRIDPAGSSRF